MTEAQRCAECDCENGGTECTWFKPGPNATSTKSEDVEASIWPVGWYAPGGYMCKCVQCSQTFQGDKRAGVCADCTIKSLVAERDALREAMTEIREMALKGCDAPNAAYRWCERIEEIALPLTSERAALGIHK